MVARCPSGKKSFNSEAVAEDVLIELWSKNNYSPASAPISIYQCDDCGQYHLTSRGPMNVRLEEQIRSGKIKLQQEANKWLNKINRKGFS